jgi:hypothetical protein
MELQYPCVVQARLAAVGDVEAARGLLEDDAARLADALAPLARESTPRAFLRRLLDAVRDLHREAPASGFLASINDTAMLEFLQDASEEELEYHSESWLQQLDTVRRYASSSTPANAVGSKQAPKIAILLGDAMLQPDGS